MAFVMTLLALNPNSSPLCLAAPAWIIAKHFKEILRRWRAVLECWRGPGLPTCLATCLEITANDRFNIETRIPDVLIIGQKRWGQFFEGVKWVEIV